MVKVCEICDIENCHHIRAAKSTSMIGHPSVEELDLAMEWLRLNDINDESGLACKKVIRFLMKIRSVRRTLT